MKTPNEIRDLAKEFVESINNGKIPNWTPLDWDNKMTFIGAFEEGYARAIFDMLSEK